MNRKIIPLGIMLSLICCSTTIDAIVYNQQVIVASAEESTNGTCGENVTWNLDSNGTLTLSGTGDMEDFSLFSKEPWYNIRENINTVIIQDGIQNIGKNAFAFCYNIVSVEIPDSVTSIGDSAFLGCTALESVTIPENVTTIGSSAFRGCDTITDIYIPKSVISIGTLTFYPSASLESIQVAEDNTMYTSIDGVLYNKQVTSLIAYPNNKKDTIYTMPNTVKSVGNLVFDLCTNLEVINLPASIISLYENKFYGCTSLYEINVYEEGSKYYSSKDGVLFNANMTEILRYPPAKQDTYYSIPDTVTTIQRDTFRGNPYIESVIIPEGVEIITPFVLTDCSNLKNVYIPVSVTTIDNSAFANSYEPFTVYYQGTEEQWNSIQNNNSTYSREHLDNAIIYYNSIPDDVPKNDSILIGDINTDGSINGLDLITLKKYILDIDNTIDYLKADINNDSFVDILDYLKLKNILLTQ